VKKTKFTCYLFTGFEPVDKMEQGEMVNCQKVNLPRSQASRNMTERPKLMFDVFGKLTLWKLTISPFIDKTAS
jgi:hypothetical protein